MYLPPWPLRRPAQAGTDPLPTPATNPHRPAARRMTRRTPRGSTHPAAAWLTVLEAAAPAKPARSPRVKERKWTSCSRRDRLPEAADRRWHPSWSKRTAPCGCSTCGLPDHRRGRPHAERSRRISCQTVHTTLPTRTRTLGARRRKPVGSCRQAQLNTPFPRTRRAPQRPPSSIIALCGS